MKFSKKIIALFAVASMMISSAVTASASFSDMTVTGDVTAKVGDIISLEATPDTLVGAKALQLKFRFDSTAFTVDTSDNEDYNFGSNKKPDYHPMWINDGFLENYLDEFAFANLWDTFTYANNEGVCGYVFGDTKNYVITAEDEAEDMYPYRTLGVNLTAAKAGTYTITVEAVVSDATAGDITSTKTIKVTVEGDEPTATEMVVGKDEITAEGKHQGKSSIATPTAVLTDGLKKIVVTNSKSDRVDTWEAPATYGDGKESVLAIITYVKDQWTGSTFNVNFLGAGDTLIQAFTYTVQ